MFERDDGKPGTGRVRTALAVAAVTALVASMAIVGTVAAQPSQRFFDVPRTHYAYESIDWAVTNGITQGCGDGRNFCPDGTLTRAEIVTFMKRYHDRFHSGASPGNGTTGARTEWSLRDYGSTYETVNLSAGRYLVSFTLEHDRAIQTDFDEIELFVSDGSREQTLHTVDTSSSNSAFSATATSYTVRARSFEIGDRLGQLESGRIYVSVELTPVNPQSSRAPYAEWEVVIEAR